MHRITPYPLRLNPELRKKLETIAKENGRSLNAEITLRIEATFSNSRTSNNNELTETIRSIIREELSKK